MHLSAFYDKLAPCKPCVRLWDLPAELEVTNSRNSAKVGQNEGKGQQIRNGTPPLPDHDGIGHGDSSLQFGVYPCHGYCQRAKGVGSQDFRRRRLRRRTPRRSQHARCGISGRRGDRTARGDYRVCLGHRLHSDCRPQGLALLSDKSSYGGRYVRRRFRSAHPERDGALHHNRRRNRRPTALCLSRDQKRER